MLDKRQVLYVTKCLTMNNVIVTEEKDNNNAIKLGAALRTEQPMAAPLESNTIRNAAIPFKTQKAAGLSFLNRSIFWYPTEKKLQYF